MEVAVEFITKVSSGCKIVFVFQGFLKEILFTSKVSSGGEIVLFPRFFEKMLFKTKVSSSGKIVLFSKVFLF